MCYVTLTYSLSHDYILNKYTYVIYKLNKTLKLLKNLQLNVSNC